MKLKHGLVLLAVAALAACGSGKPEGVVQFHGAPPNTSKQQEKFKQSRTIREYTTACPNCGREIEFGKVKCGNKVCATAMSWPKEYVCGSCKGTGNCTACVNMEQFPTGECYNCRGKGDLIINGQARDCPNCKGKKVCPICEGKKTCDWCKGAGRVSDEFVKSHLRKSAGDEDEEKKPEAAPAPKTEPKPEDKKPEEKKPDEKKPEEK
jgi:hypothetical protein